jgi:hypothetical protein
LIQTALLRLKNLPWAGSEDRTFLGIFSFLVLNLLNIIKI